VILDQLPIGERSSTGRVMLYAGRLLPLKGVSLAILALERLRGWRLIVCGNGSDSMRLRALARDRQLGDRVDFRGWVERTEVLRVMREEASVFVFPSLHDEAGWVVVEAMASGLPVVYLSVGGPPILAGCATSVTPAGTRTTVELIAQRVVEATETDRDKLRARASEFLLEERLERLAHILRAHHLVEFCQ
jgi:glycosyltransferase involved in cell wall biosynthesis